MKGQKAVSPIKVLIPLYAWPTKANYNATWGRVTAFAAANRGKVGVIVNPDSGPNGISSPDYASGVRKLFCSGAVLFGYVYTNYGGRKASLVSADVKKYKAAGITNIFFDEVSTASSAKTYYAGLLSLVGGQTVFNPGIPAPSWMHKYVNWVVVFETSVSRWNAEKKLQASGNAAAMALGVSSDVLAIKVIAEAKKLKYGLVFVTPGKEPEPYDVVPPVTWLNAMVV